MLDRTLHWLNDRRLSTCSLGRRSPVLLQYLPFARRRPFRNMGRLPHRRIAV